jgi:hypothetical protein
MILPNLSKFATIFSQFVQYAFSGSTYANLDATSSILNPTLYIDTKCMENTIHTAIATARLPRRSRWGDSGSSISRWQRSSLHAHGPVSLLSQQAAGSPVAARKAAARPFPATRRHPSRERPWTAAPALRPPDLAPRWADPPRSTA